MVYIIIATILIAACLLYVRDKRWVKEWENNKRNFQFKYRGKKFWYSRACATTFIVFCKDLENDWCVLINKRGKGCSDYSGFWNLICGYLEYNISGAENCAKECKEETGIEIPLDKIKFYGVNSSPTQHLQNVGLRYYAILDGKTTDYVTTNKYCELNEVDKIAWHKIKEIDMVKLAFNHNSLVKEVFLDVIK